MIDYNPDDYKWVDRVVELIKPDMSSLYGVIRGLVELKEKGRLSIPEVLAFLPRLNRAFAEVIWDIVSNLSEEELKYLIRTFGNEEDQKSLRKA